MRNLFYSEAEKILFWVSGYDVLNCNPDVIVVEAVTKILSDAKKLADIVDRDVKEVYTLYVEYSTRYKSMRVFYIEDVEQYPSEAFVLNDKWTMFKWLQ